jgi:MOSC domain-containing protein YiiM
MQGIIKAICLSQKKGTIKKPIEYGILKADYGLQGDAHAGSSREVSLLAWDSIVKMQNLGLKLAAGSFAENITTEGIDLLQLKIGDRLEIAGKILLEITQIGKECHRGCEIRDITGDCVMPREGLFARVLKGGRIQPGDKIIKAS